MGKAAAGTPKAIANAIKAKGLGRLRWYCQVCEKQMRDENGFQAHARSEPHLRKLMLVGPKAGAAIADWSKQFQTDFLTLLRTQHGTQRVRANQVYNHLVNDKHHVHMSATRWVTLSGFIMTIGKEGLVKVDEDEKGLWISWVDNSPETLAKQAAAQRKDRAQMDGEERERKMLEEQIARAKKLAEDAEGKKEDEGLKRDEGGAKISLNLTLPTPATTSIVAAPSAPTDNANDAGPSKGISLGSFSLPSSSNPIATPASVNTNPLKRPAPVNVFKASKAAKTEKSEAPGGMMGGMGKKGGAGYMSEAERLMKEDQARRMGGGGGARGVGAGSYGGIGPQRQGPRKSNF